MEKITRMNAGQRDNLVAYLDGELSEAEAKDIERSLIGNPVAQREVEMLSRTWDMLDLLPKASVSGEFTHKTVTMARVDKTRILITDAPWFSKARRTILLASWGVALALAAAVGFTATREWIPSEARTLIDNLPVIEHLDQYVEADSIEFLQQLKMSGAAHDLPAQ